jgi:hypothetical protein
MTVRSTPHAESSVPVAHRNSSARLFQQPLSKWYAEWKAGKAASKPAPAQSPPAGESEESAR